MCDEYLERPEDLGLAEENACARLGLIILLLLVAIFAPVGAYFDLCRPEAIAKEEWFGRSGAIVSVFSLIAGLSLSSYRASFEGTGFSCVYKAKAFKKYKGCYQALTVTYVALAILGSLVWGYGDIALS